MRQPRVRPPDQRRRPGQRLPVRPLQLQDVRQLAEKHPPVPAAHRSGRLVQPQRSVFFWFSSTPQLCLPAFLDPCLFASLFFHRRCHAPIRPDFTLVVSEPRANTNQPPDRSPCAALVSRLLFPTLWLRFPSVSFFRQRPSPISFQGPMAWCHSLQRSLARHSRALPPLALLTCFCLFWF